MRARLTPYVASAPLIAALIGTGAILPACSTTLPGTPAPAGPAGTSTTTPAPSLVSASAINGKLLTRNELAAIVGDTGMVETQNFTQPEYQSENFSPEQCGQRVLVANNDAYYDNQRAAMAGNRNRGAADTLAGQVLSIWASQSRAEQMVKMSADDWHLCGDGQPFTITETTGPQQWTPGPVTVINFARIATVVQRQRPTARGCAHIMASQLNVVVETLVCAADGDINAQANQIADRILAKFPL